VNRNGVQDRDVFREKSTKKQPSPNRTNKHPSIHCDSGGNPLDSSVGKVQNVFLDGFEGLNLVFDAKFHLLMLVEQ
jgi:hypothetical protein